MSQCQVRGPSEDRRRMAGCDGAGGRRIIRGPADYTEGVVGDEACGAGDGNRRARRHFLPSGRSLLCRKEQGGLLGLGRKGT